MTEPRNTLVIYFFYYFFTLGTKIKDCPLGTPSRELLVASEDRACGDPGVTHTLLADHKLIK